MHHTEHHFTATEVVRDIVIGMSDGLTVPFALAAGLSGTVKSTNIVVIAGFAEIAAGSIAMGLGGYLAAKTDLEHYHAEEQREYLETQEKPDVEAQEVAEIFHGYGLSAAQAAPVVEAIKSDTKRWVDFMMRFELGLEEPDPDRARKSASLIAASYIVGGLIPLFPYMVWHQVRTALWISTGVTPVALFVFGFIKGRFTGVSAVRAGIQTAFIGGLAAAAAFAIARAIS
ncbi:MAG TPA: VIT1/CCC1 transporter family protein [Bryobacteraceae bacterium]|nr:VIT1/CCC1 transporter family protein [Bryobacteraceae bacterium]